MNSRSAGFTLLELLVAASLMAMVVGGMVALITTALAGWNKYVGEMALTMQAEAAFDLLEADLAGLRFRSATGEGLVVVEILEEREVVDQRIALHFFSDSAGPIEDAGSLRRVLWTAQMDPGDSPFIDDAIPSLFRQTAPPEETSAALQNNPFGTPASDLGDGYLLADCLVFRIEIWGCLNDGSFVQLFPQPGAGHHASGDLLRFPFAVSPGEPWSTPCYMDVFLGLLTERTSDLLRARRQFASPSDGEEERWIAENLVMFTRRIPLQTGRF